MTFTATFADIAFTASSYDTNRWIKLIKSLERNFYENLLK